LAGGFVDNDEVTHIFALQLIVRIQQFNAI